MISSYLNMDGRRGPLGFLLSFIVFAALGLGLYEAAHYGLHFNHHFSGLSIFLGIIGGIVCYAVILTQSVRRLNDMGGAGILSLLSIIPTANIPLFLVFSPAAIFGSILIVVPILGVVSLIILMLPSKG